MAICYIEMRGCFAQIVVQIAGLYLSQYMFIIIVVHICLFDIEEIGISFMVMQLLGAMIIVSMMPTTSHLFYLYIKCYRTRENTQIWWL